MEHQKLRENVRVYADFNGQHVRPVAFQWGGKRYDVERVNLVYRRRLGARYVWCFAVSDEAHNFVLMYDPESLRWILEEVSTAV